ncbi:hypothetical protein GEMRC1_008308 [Eukaryota sp. GEM-RC1]
MPSTPEPVQSIVSSEPSVKRSKSSSSDTSPFSLPPHLPVPSNISLNATFSSLLKPLSLKNSIREPQGSSHLSILNSNLGSLSLFINC